MSSTNMSKTNMPRRITSDMLFDSSFQDMFNLLNTTPAFGMGKSMPSYPHFNVTEIDENDNYRVEVALAGFDKNDISVQFEPYKKSGYTNVKVLSITANHTHSDVEEEKYIYKNIAKRDASVSLLVGQDDEAVSCSYENGILTVTMKKVRTEKDKEVHKIDIQ